MRQAITTLAALVLLFAIAAVGSASLSATAGSDGDGDGVSDGVDACPSVAEDADGVDELDGCPDTDASVSVVKEEAYSVAVGTTETKTIDISIDNGNYPADILAHVLAVSTIGACEVALVPEPGDGDVVFLTDEDGDTVSETRSHLLEWELILAANSVLQTSRDYEVTCLTPGQHSFEIQVDVVPLPPVEEEDVEDLANVHKNFPAVTVNDGSEVDSDGDGFSDAVEAYVGTEPAEACPSTAIAGDEEPDAFPADFDDNQVVNITDVSQLLPPQFGASSGSENFGQREDLNPDGVINITDVSRVLPPVFGSSCG